MMASTFSSAYEPSCQWKLNGSAARAVHTSVVIVPSPRSSASTVPTEKTGPPRPVAGSLYHRASDRATPGRSFRFQIPSSKLGKRQSSNLEPGTWNLKSRRLDVEEDVQDVAVLHDV